MREKQEFTIEHFLKNDWQRADPNTPSPWSELARGTLLEMNMGMQSGI